MLLCLLLALGAGWLAWLALEGRTAWDALEAMPVTPLAYTSDGDVVRVSGRVVFPGPALRTPLQGRPCVGYRLELTGTKAPRATEAWGRFELHDESGKAVVETRVLELLLARTHEVRATPGAPLPGPVAALAQVGDAPTGWRECWVEAEDPVTARARVARSAEGLRLVTPAGEPLRISTLERLARRG